MDIKRGEVRPGEVEKLMNVDVGDDEARRAAARVVENASQVV